MASSTGSPPGKRLIVCCDGTWLNSDNGVQQWSSTAWGTSIRLQRPSNVTRISRAIRPTSATGIPQIIYYQSGIGSGLRGLAHIYSGATGAGLAEHIREAYAFIVDSYCEGDEIFLIGFSSGAFTARSIAGFIASIGLLTTKGMAYFYSVFKDWENRETLCYVSPWPTEPFPDKPRITTYDSQYARRLESLVYTRLNVPIRAVAVWDTVGALRIPKISMFPPVVREYVFVSQEVPRNVEYAFHALALDERRQAFAPTMWEKPLAQPLPKVLKQCWFPGAHCSVGGGRYEDTQMANISLAWMMSQLDQLIDFDRAYLFWVQEFNKEYYRKQHLDRPWGCGKIYNSFSGIERLATEVRTPMKYRAVDSHSGRTLHVLRNTFECVHRTVRIRMELGMGKGPEDKGSYRPPALHGWRVGPADEGRYVWIPDEGNEIAGVMMEDELGPLEVEFMNRTSAQGG